MAKWPSDPRERALALRAAGKLGRPEDAARGRRQRIENAHERIRQIGVRHAQKVERALVAGLESGSVSQRLKAAELVCRFWLEAERHETRQEVEQGEAMDRQALIGLLAERLTGSGLAAQMLRREIEQSPIEGDAIEVREECQ